MSTLMGHYRLLKGNWNFVKPQNVSDLMLKVCQEVLLAASKNQAELYPEDCVQKGGQLFTLPLRRKD